MKKFCLRILLFSLLFFFSYPLILMLWGSVAPDYITSNLHTKVASGYTVQRLSEIKKVSRPDILFLGSSHTYRGFDPRIFKSAGYEVFNLGTSAQKIPVTEFLLRRYLKQIHPKLVVFCIDPSMLIGNPVESIVDITYSDSLAWDMVRLVVQEPDIRTFHALIWKFAAEVSGRQLHFKKKKSNTGDRYISGGFVENIARSSNVSLRKRFVKLNSAHITSFESCLSLLMENKIPYVLVTTPFTHPYYEISNRIRHDSIFPLYGKYRDFNAIPGIQDPVNFYDDHHLNQRGVEEFNRHVIDWLCSLGYDPSSLKD